MKIAVLDIGGTFIKSGLYEDGELSMLKETPTPGPPKNITIMACAKELLREYESFDAIGVSTTGQVDFDRGVIRGCICPENGYLGTDIRGVLEEEFHVPVSVDNDVNAAAIGEAYFGAGRDSKDFLCLTYGTGVGGAIVLDRKVFRGSSFSAGEFGWMITHGNEHHKHGGFRSGSYDETASTTALVRSAVEFNPELKDGRIIFSRIDEPEVKKIVDTWIEEVLLGLANLIYIFNPSCIVLGGGVMGQEYILQEIQRRLGEYVMPSFMNVTIRLAEKGNHAGLLGAAVEAEELWKTTHD